MKQLCDYENRSEDTLLSLIRNEGYPARKIGGIWESDTELVDQWRRNLIIAGDGVDPVQLDLSTLESDAASVPLPALQGLVKKLQGVIKTRRKVGKES